MRLLFQFIILVFVLNACSSNIDVQKENYVFQNNLEAYNSQRYMLLEYYWIIQETAQDRSENPDALKKINVLFLTVDAMRNELEVIIQEIESLKMDILKQSGNKLHSPKMDPEDSLALYEFDFENLTNNDASFESYNKNGKFQTIKSNIFKFRNSLIQHAVNSSNTEERKFSFKDPKILDFSDEKKANLQLDKSLKLVAPDDYEAVKQQYYKISLKNLFLDKDFEDFLEGKSVMEQINIFTNIQTQLVSSTLNLFRLIRSRFTGCGGNQFNLTFINVDGPEIVKAGDSVELRIFQSYYDSYLTPLVNYNRKSTRQYLKGGVTYIKFKAGEQDEVLNGTFTTLNMAGVPKTVNWEKKIKILQK